MAQVIAVEIYDVFTKMAFGQVETGAKMGLPCSRPHPRALDFRSQ
jgi:hypothetical protein